jgi:uncharacterized membrane protein YdfJ with MMPL/SSD domain
MKRTHGSEPSVTETQQAINSMAVTVSAIHIATHSVVVTVFVTAGCTLLTAWAWWAAHRQNQCLTAGEARAPRNRANPTSLDTGGSRPGSAH